MNMQKITSSQLFADSQAHTPTSGPRVGRISKRENVVCVQPHAPQVAHKWKLWKGQNTDRTPHTHTTPFRGCGMWGRDVGRKSGYGKSHNATAIHQRQDGQQTGERVIFYAAENTQKIARLRGQA